MPNLTAFWTNNAKQKTFSRQCDDFWFVWTRQVFQVVTLYKYVILWPRTIMLFSLVKISNTLFRVRTPKESAENVLFISARTLIIPKAALDRMICIDIRRVSLKHTTLMECNLFDQFEILWDGRIPF